MDSSSSESDHEDLQISPPSRPDAETRSEPRWPRFCLPDETFHTVDLSDIPSSQNRSLCEASVFPEQDLSQMDYETPEPDFAPAEHLRANPTAQISQLEEHHSGVFSLKVEVFDESPPHYLRTSGNSQNFLRDFTLASSNEPESTEHNNEPILDDRDRDQMDAGMVINESNSDVPEQPIDFAETAGMQNYNQPEVDVANELMQHEVDVNVALGDNGVEDPEVGNPAMAVSGNEVRDVQVIQVGSMENLGKDSSENEQPPVPNATIQVVPIGMPGNVEPPVGDPVIPVLPIQMPVNVQPPVRDPMNQEVRMDVPGNDAQRIEQPPVGGHIIQRVAIEVAGNEAQGIEEVQVLHIEMPENVEPPVPDPANQDAQMEVPEHEGQRNEQPPVGGHVIPEVDIEVAQNDAHGIEGIPRRSPVIQDPAFEVPVIPRRLIDRTNWNFPYPLRRNLKDGIEFRRGQNIETNEEVYLCLWGNGECGYATALGERNSAGQTPYQAMRTHIDETHEPQVIGPREITRNLASRNRIANGPAQPERPVRSIYAIPPDNAMEADNGVQPENAVAQPGNGNLENQERGMPEDEVMQ
ncbi:unnamed protein product [Orchesella dallaii]|uniref:Uncharacterized protein n=1 Tax=Orchesella dallaii TaxID=48710 RepID=A0ABP1QKC3_9HEXA